MRQGLLTNGYAVRVRVVERTGEIEDERSYQALSLVSHDRFEDIVLGGHVGPSFYPFLFSYANSFSHFRDNRFIRELETLTVKVEMRGPIVYIAKSLKYVGFRLTEQYIAEL